MPDPKPQGTIHDIAYRHAAYTLDGGVMVFLPLKDGRSIKGAPKTRAAILHVLREAGLADLDRTSLRRKVNEALGYTISNASLSSALRSLVDRGIVDRRALRPGVHAFRIAQNPPEWNPTLGGPRR